MPSDQKKLTVNGLVERFFAPNTNLRDTNSRQQARFTIIASLILGTASLLVGIIGLFIGFASIITSGIFIVAITMGIAYILARTENYLVGSVLLVSGLILGGFFFAGGYSDIVIIIIILMATLVPALTIGLFLLPLLAIIIIAVIVLITIGILPLMATITASTELLLFLVLSIVEAVYILIAWNRETTEGLQQDEIGSLRGRLEERVEERTRFTRITADIAQEIISSSNIEELLNQAVNLTAVRFGFEYVGILLSDEAGQTLELKAVQGSYASKLIESPQRTNFGPPSLLGWVAENRHHRMATRNEISSDEIQPDFIAENQSEVGIPILSGNKLIGVMDVQSTRKTIFDNETIVVLQMLASQISIAMQNVRLIEYKQGGIQEKVEVYLAGFKIVQSSKLSEIIPILQELFTKVSYISMFLTAENEDLKISASTTTNFSSGQILPDIISLSINDLKGMLASEIFIGEGNRLNSLPYNLLRFIQQLGIFSVAIIPVNCDEKMTNLLLIGTREKTPLSIINTQPYANLANQIGSTLDRLRQNEITDKRLQEMETITAIGTEISTIQDLNSIYNSIHTHIRQLFGDVNFLVAIYNENTNSISIPYVYEKGFEGGDISSIETFPLGEGLTSILIRTKEPLMITQDAENTASALGAKIVGKSAKSWLGSPMIISDQAIGALIIQDVENEGAFTDEDRQLLMHLSTQVAGAIYNARLLELIHNRAVQLQTAAEVARDISGSLDLGELLSRSVALIYDRFDFYHAAIFLLDPAGEYAIIREATGEAGIQMKRSEHKLKVGSNSIVGHVTGTGESLIVNDTTRDATYYANPLLPQTRSEVAIPLKIGERVLGALDVQSVRAYSFGEDDISVLRILADQMAIAVINSELFADTQEHLSQHRLLHHVTTAAASGTTLEESLNSATHGLQVTLGGDRVSILLADKSRQVLKVSSFAGYSEEIGRLEIPYGEGITGWVALNQQPLRINDVSQDPRYIQVGSNIRSELAIPLSYRGDLLGVLNVESDQSGAYNDNDEEVLGTLGGSLAAIISNARLIEQVRRQVDHQRVLFEVTSKIRRSSDMQKIMATTTSELSKLLGARRAQIKIKSENDSDVTSSTDSKPGTS